MTGLRPDWKLQHKQIHMDSAREGVIVVAGGRRRCHAHPLLTRINHQPDYIISSISSLFYLTSHLLDQDVFRYNIYPKRTSIRPAYITCGQTSKLHNYRTLPLPFPLLIFIFIFLELECGRDGSDPTATYQHDLIALYGTRAGDGRRVRRV